MEEVKDRDVKNLYLKSLTLETYSHTTIIALDETVINIWENKIWGPFF